MWIHHGGIDNGTGSHGSAKTTYAVRAAIQRSKATIAELASQYDLNPKTVMKWRKRDTVEDMAMGPKDARCVMTALSQDELPRDTNVLRTLVQHNRVQVGVAGQFLCAVVYAVVQAPGAVRTGDRVSLA